MIVIKCLGLIVGALVLSGSAAAQQLPGVVGHAEREMVTPDPARAPAGEYVIDQGHAAVIGEAGRVAREAGAPWAVLTFEPHPRDHFQPGTAPFRLTPFRAKARGLAEMGVDYMINLRFDARLAAMPARDFVRDVLLDGLGVSHIVAGPDFVFGKGRAGDVRLLDRMSRTGGFGFTAIEPRRHAGRHGHGADALQHTLPTPHGQGPPEKSASSCESQMTESAVPQEHNVAIAAWSSPLAADANYSTRVVGVDQFSPPPA